MARGELSRSVGVARRIGPISDRAASDPVERDEARALANGHEDRVEQASAQDEHGQHLGEEVLVALVTVVEFIVSGEVLPDRPTPRARALPHATCQIPWHSVGEPRLAQRLLYAVKERHEEPGTQAVTVPRYLMLAGGTMFPCACGGADVEEPVVLRDAYVKAVLPGSPAIVGTGRDGGAPVIVEEHFGRGT